MPNKFKFNSVCKKNIHINNPVPFARHVFSCPECQKGLPPEVLEEIKPYMEKLKMSKAKTDKQKLEASKTEANKQKSVKISEKDKEIKSTKVVQKEVDKTTPSPEPATKSNAEILIEATQKIPAVGVLVSAIKVVSENNQKSSTKLNDDVSQLSTEVGALKDGFTGLGEAIKVLTQKVIEGQGTANVLGDEKLATKKPAKEVKTVEEKTPAPIEKTPESQETTISGKKDLPKLSPQEVGEMETFLAKEKARLGQGEGKPAGEGPTGVINPVIGGVKDTVREIRGLIDAFTGRGGEAPALPRTTEELATQVLLNTVKAAGDRKDPMEYLTKGMEIQNTNLSNAVKLFASITGKGGGISADDIRKIVREEMGGKGEGIS